MESYSTHSINSFRNRYRAIVLELLIILVGIIFVISAFFIPTLQDKLLNVKAATPYELPYLYPNSYWTTKIPASVQLASNSAAIANQVGAQARDHYSGLGINTSNYAPSFFVGNNSHPRINFGSNNCQNKSGNWDSGLKSWLSNVPVPPNAQPSPGTDSEMVIYDSSKDIVFNMWRANHPSKGGWNACWGGFIRNVKNSNAIFTESSGATASGLEFTAGSVYPHEILAATNSKFDTIKHALHIAMPKTACKPNISWPATRTDGKCDKYGPHLWQGQRLRLDPNFQIPSNWHPGTKAIVKAMQDYGMVVRDTAGAVTLYGINENSFPGLANPWDTALDRGQLRSVPMDRIQVLPLHWGKPGSSTDYKKYQNVSPDTVTNPPSQPAPVPQPQPDEEPPDPTQSSNNNSGGGSTTVDGKCTASGSSLDDAKNKFNQQCADFIDTRDCDPIGNGWTCSSEQIGSASGSSNSNDESIPSAPVVDNSNDDTQSTNTPANTTEKKPKPDAKPVATSSPVTPDTANGEASPTKLIKNAASSINKPVDIISTLQTFKKVNEDITLNSDVVENPETIQRVDYFIDDQPVAIATTEPFGLDTSELDDSQAANLQQVTTYKDGTTRDQKSVVVIDNDDSFLGSVKGAFSSFGSGVGKVVQNNQTTTRVLVSLFGLVVIGYSGYSIYKKRKNSGGYTQPPTTYYP